MVKIAQPKPPAPETAVLSAGARAYEVIKDDILAGRFAPGERLKEDELTARCQVSRTPVREALHRLGVEGLVVVTPNAGAQVAVLEPKDLAEIYTLRAMIEGHAAERAAAHISSDQLRRLEALAADMEAAVETGGGEALNRRFTPANAEFHHIILEAAMSPRLAAMAALVIELPLTLRALARYSDADRRRSLRHHRELIDALQARDGAWAASVMKSHVHAAFRALVRSEQDGPGG
jgi:DNA-binding GntR family transcriptional regulator